MPFYRCWVNWSLINKRSQIWIKIKKFWLRKYSQKFLLQKFVTIFVNKIFFVTLHLPESNELSMMYGNVSFKVSPSNSLRLGDAYMCHWTGSVTFGSDNGLSPIRRQAIIWTNAGILLIGPLGTNFSEILFGIQTFPFKKMHLKMSSAKQRPFCLDLNVLMYSFVCQAACLHCHVIMFYTTM